MPIYEYQCSKCEHQLEAIQKFSDAPLSQCPACNEPALKKLVSAASFRLKGGGWYETDFKKEGRKQLAESDSSSAPASKESGETTGSKTKTAASGGETATKTETVTKKTSSEAAKN